MKNKIKIIIPVIFFLIVIYIVYSFLFGKLFPYSPLIIGFSKNEINNAVIYIENGAKYTDFDKIDSLFPSIEDFFKLKFKSKPRIFIFKNKKSYFRRSLSKTRFCSFYSGDIVIAPWALKESQTGEISLSIYLKHELTHSLIHQHCGLMWAWKFPKWLHEGAAMYVAGQMGTSFYPSKEETYGYIRKGNFIHPRYYRTKQEKQTKLDVSNRIGFIYSEFACIVDFLIEQYGRDRFLSYIKTMITGNNNDRAFQDIYGIEFNELINDFKEKVNL